MLHSVIHSKYELIESISAFWLVETNESFIIFTRFIWNRDIARNNVQKYDLLSKLEKMSIIY